MLTVAKVTQGNAQGYADYLEGKAQAPELGDYYLKDGDRVEAPGRWAAGATTVGCDPDAPVSGEELRELMAVRRPDTHLPLRRAGGTGESVAAIDATFSAPKSVSAIWAIANPELRAEIERAHEHAVDQALGYSLAQVKMIRQRVDAGTVIHTKASGLVATSWRHTTARAVEDQAPDPQLHFHVLLHAAVRRDGRTVAIDSRSWLVHRREVGAAYRSELARELNQLGFDVRRGTGRGARYFEISGVPQELIDRWSSRHHQVQTAIRQRLHDQERALELLATAGGPQSVDAAQRLELLRETGQLSPKEERFMATAARSPKTPVSHHQLDEEWQRAARQLGFTARHVDGLQHPRTPLPAAEQRAVMDGLTEFDATFPARDARAVALEQSAGTPIQDALTTLRDLRDLRDADEILQLADGTGTTRAHRARERATVRTAEHLAARELSPMPARLVAEQIGRLDAQLAGNGGRLSDEQRQAIELACGSRQLVIIEGQAGTGKSTTLTGIALAHQHAGQTLIVTSTAALAAERLAAELEHAGVTVTAYSTAALHAAIDTGRVELTGRTTVIHDEAALASTREQQHLLDAAERSGARLVEVGDPQQNQPVGAGGLWHHLETTTRQVGAHVELTTNQRAKDPADRRDQAHFRHGATEKAVRAYAARDRVHFTGEQRRAEDRALDAAQRDRHAGKDTIVIAQTSNERLDELNARAQAIRKQNNELGDDAFPLPGRPYELRPGDEIQLRRNLTHASYGRLRNGTTANITNVDADDRTIELELSDGHHIILDEQQAAGADLRLAYVQHPFPAQGQTTDTAHLIVGEHVTREGTYVAITRARDETHIHAAAHVPVDGDRLHHLADRIGRTEPDLPSIDLPLAQEEMISAHPDQRAVRRQAVAGDGRPGSWRSNEPEPVSDQLDTIDQIDGEPRADQLQIGEPHGAPEPRFARAEAVARSHAPKEHEQVSDHRSRHWPTRRDEPARAIELTNDKPEPEPDGSPGWER